MITYRFVSQTFLGEPIKVQYSKYSSPTRIDLGSGTFPFEYTTDQKGGTYYFYIPKLDTTFTKTIDIPPIDFVVNSMNVPDCDISGIINEIPECDITSVIIEIPVCDVDYNIVLATPTPTPTTSVVCPILTGVTVGPIEISGGEYTLADNTSSLYLHQFDSSGQYICDIPSQSNSILPDSLFQDEITVLVPSPYWFGGPCQYCFNINTSEEVTCNFVIPSPTPTPSVTSTVTPTPTITSSITPSITNTITPTPSITETLFTTLTPTPTNTPTNTLTSTITQTPTVTTTNTPTNTLTPSITPTILPCFTFNDSFAVTEAYESRLYYDSINGYMILLTDTLPLIQIMNTGGLVQTVTASTNVNDIVINTNYQLLYAISSNSIEIYSISASTYSLVNTVSLPIIIRGATYDYDNNYLALTSESYSGVSIYDVNVSFIQSGITQISNISSQILYDTNYSSTLGVPTFVLYNGGPIIEVVTYSGGTINTYSTMSVSGVTEMIYNPNDSYLITNENLTGNIRVIDLVNEVIITTIPSLATPFLFELSLDESNNILYAIDSDYIFKFNMNTYSFVCKTNVIGSEPYDLSTMRYSSLDGLVYIGYDINPSNIVSLYTP